MPKGEYLPIKFVCSVDPNDVESLFDQSAEPELQDDNDEFDPISLTNISRHSDLERIGNSGTFTPTEVRALNLDIKRNETTGVAEYNCGKCFMIGGLVIAQFGYDKKAEISIIQNNHRRLTYYSAVGYCSLILGEQ